MEDFKIIHSTPILQAINSSGRKKFWRGVVSEEYGYGEIVHYTISWQELESGELSKKNQSAFTKVVQGKNIGRANETTPVEQAILEIESLMNKKLDEGYHEEGTESPVLPLPMLAHKFTDRGDKIQYSCFVQPKLDGSRMLFDGKKGWSRKGKLYIPEVIKHLQFDTGGYIVDGECMLPQQDHTFQTSMSAIKKFDPELSPQLQYHVFDIVDPKSPFETRLSRLTELFQAENIPNNVHMVKTYLCNNEDEVAGWLAKALAKGYEGLILRNADALYAVGQRSVGLQKLKEFIDAEFEITGCVDGKGREAGAIIYTCKTESGGEFTVRPEGSVESRKELWQQWKSKKWTPVGQMLTVRMQEYSDSGIPRFPVGVSIRNYED